MQPRKYMPLLILAGYTAMGASEQALSLEDAIRVALENNFSYRIAAIDPEIAKENVTGQEAAFDTVIFASGQVSQYEESSPGINSSDYRNWKAGAQKRLVYGTTVTAQTNLDRSAGESNNVRLPLNQEADFSLSIRQPLLRGFGREANTANIERAKAGFTATTEGYRQAVLDLLAQTEAAYWQVARLQEKLSLDESNRTVAETLLEEAVEKKRVGLATSIEVLQAEAFRAETKEAIIDTTRALGDAYDLLLVYMGSLPGTGFSIGANQPVQALPENGRPLPEFQEAWTLALERDPSLAAQAAVIEQRKWEQVSTRNSARPSLDLVLSGAYSGADETGADNAYQDAIDREGEEWAIGLEFSMPWSRREEKANMRVAGKRLEQEWIRHDEIKQELFRAVRSSWRALSAVQQSLEAARLTVSLQEATFEREKSKYAQGLSSFRDVLESQRDLDQARVRLLRSKYNKLAAEIDLARLAGTLFERHGISPSLPEIN